MAVSVWRIIALHTPRVSRRCPRCDTTRAFASSDRFRINANGRRLDAWLIYRCTHCAQSWNLTVFERVAPDTIGADLLDRLHGNDRDTAWAVAFDRDRLTRAGADADFATAFRVDRGGNDRHVHFELPHPCRVRLDRVLAGELGLPRARMRRIARAAGIDARTLRRTVHDGQCIQLPLVHDAP